MSLQEMFRSCSSDGDLMVSMRDLCRQMEPTSLFEMTHHPEYGFCLRANSVDDGGTRCLSMWFRDTGEVAMRTGYWNGSCDSTTMPLYEDQDWSSEYEDNYWASITEHFAWFLRGVR
jgi:hypothetical protein